jgi:hypothetical protein
VVRSPAAVRTAFEGQRGLAWWWNIVLALHGKPGQTAFSAEHRCRCVAEGFRFYGWLYRLLALVFGAAALLCWFCSLADSFWLTLLAASSIYLWIIAGLAFSGAVEFCVSAGERVWPLVAFLFFVTIFLTSVLIAVSVQVRLAGWLPDVTNIIITLGTMAFGVGSYLVELAALVTGNPLRKERVA